MRKHTLQSDHYQHRPDNRKKIEVIVGYEFGHMDDRRFVKNAYDELAEDSVS